MARVPKLDGEARVLIWFLIIIFVVGPALAVAANKRREKNADRLMAEVRAELAAKNADQPPR